MSEFYEPTEDFYKNISEYKEPELWTRSLQPSVGEMFLKQIEREAEYALLDGGGVGDYLLEHPLVYAPRRDRTWDSLGREFLLQSDVFTRSSKDDRDTMIATWWGNPSWVYATQNSADGLWAENIPALTKPMTELDRMVASGVLGNSMLFHRHDYDYDDEDGNGNGLLELVQEQYEAAPLDTAIVVAGLAVYRAGKKRSNGSGMYGQPVGEAGLAAWTTTGGDFHGDFRTERLGTTVQPIATSVDERRRHMFMPVYSSERVGAYHSVEPALVGALLHHLVVRTDADPVDLHRGIANKLKEMRINVGGDFGDYGHDDGDREARMLRYALKEESFKNDEPEYKLLSTIVMPQTKNYFHVVSLPDAIQFRNLDEENDIAYQTMTIPNNEIVDYIVALVSGGGGRTSPDAMAKVIDALVEK